jgi:hypothetical protein
MGKTALKYWAVLVGAYLGVYYASGGGKLIDAGTRFVTGTTKALQGR